MSRGFPSQLGRCLTWLLVLGLVGVRAGCATGSPCEEGEPLVQYFSPRDYNGGTQCLSATQDAQGVMYVGSLGVMLEYDGSTWRKIDVDSNWVCGLAYRSSTDTVFVGAQNNLGYLKTLPGGAKQFVSLLDQLPADVRDVGAVCGVYATSEGVFFIGTHRVMRWRDDRFRTWELPAASKLESAWAAGALYVSSPEVGLLRLDGDALAAASDDPLFRRAWVRAVEAQPDGSLLIGTRNEGLFVLRDHTVRPAECECSDFLKRAGIYRMLRVKDGSLAIATDIVGLLVLDPALRFRSRLDEKGILGGRVIYNLFEDMEGGLWIGLQSGVARAEINSPLSILRAGPNADLSSAYSVTRWSGTTVLGNQSGLFRVATAQPAAAVGAHLEWIPGSIPSETALCAVGNGLLTISKGKVFLLGTDTVPVPVAEEVSEAQDLVSSHAHPGRVYVIDGQGSIRALRLDAATRHWVSDGVVADVGPRGGVFGLRESAPGDLWVATTEHGLFRVQFAADGAPQVTPFLDRAGPLRGCRNVAVCDGDGPLRFVAPYKLCGLNDSGRELRALTEFGEQFNDGTHYLGGAMSYDAGSIWLTATDVKDPTGESLRGRALAGGPDRQPTFRPLPHKVEEAIGKVGVFHPADTPNEPPATLLLVGTIGSGVVRMDVRRWDAEPPPRPFATLVRRAIASGGKSVASEPILRDPLPYERDSAHFEFAAATMAFGAAPSFQTRLANFGAGEWSEFTGRNSVDYLNLPEGEYVFEVRARNSDGQLGSVASLPFRVLPPWQRTPWAYALYALTLAMALAAIIRWRGRQLHHRNAVLAALVDARTSELRGRETELVRARDEAEGANRAKSAFLANMSHELRTPLNAVLGYTQLLLKQTDLAPRSRERIAVIGQSGGHLLSLVNEVLDLSKVEAGKLALSQFDFSLPGLLDEVAAAFRPRLLEKGLTFAETRAPDLPATVHSDPSRLRQVLYNMLSNATKFTHHGGVTLAVRPTAPGRVCFEVSDTGVGIEPKDQQDIFLAFHQAGESSLASQGTGLGLTISQRLVELLGGRIGVESTPGEGSRFWVDLPLASVESMSGSSKHAAQDPALGKVTGYEGATRQLLLVDDLTENRRVLRDFLQPLGFEIGEAADGTSCLAACARQMPDAVLLDLRLGTPDGFEVARRLRAGGDGARTGIIAISASVFESDRQQAIDAGCDDFLPKPFEEPLLLATLGRVLGLRWVRETPPASESTATGVSADPEGTLPVREIAEMRALSLSGDVAGIRRCLDTWRAGDPRGGAGEIVRRLESLVASYDMEGIHDLLLTIQPHARD